MQVETIVVILQPFLVWGATEIAKKIFGVVDKTKILAIIVPFVSLAIALLGTIVGGVWYVSLAVGLASVFLNEIWKALSKAGTTT